MRSSPNSLLPIYALLRRSSLVFSIPNTFGASALTESCIPLLLAAKVPLVVFANSETGSIAAALDEAVHPKELTWSCMQYKVSEAVLDMVAACFARRFDG